MTTENELRSALRARAADAPAVDTDRLLTDLAGRPEPVRVSAVRSHGRQWAIAGVAAAIVAAVAVPTALVATGSDSGAPRPVDAGDPVAATSSSSPSTVPWATEGRGAPRPLPSTPLTNAEAPTPSATATNPYDPAAPAPLDPSWVDTAGNPSVQVDPAAIVFSSDPIVGFYVRPHEQLSILPAGGTRADSSDASWDTAVQVHLAGSGFDPSTMGDPTSVTVDGIARRFGTLPKLLDRPGPAQMPSLLWQVGDAWVVLQIDSPAVPTQSQLAVAAARVDVHHG